MLSFDGAGHVSVFATLPNTIPLGTCVEDYISIAPASGVNPQSASGFPTISKAGFKSNYVYVTQGPAVFQIPLDGSVSTFATISSCPASSNGITFDRVGTFGNQLIVVCSNGQVWLLDKNGNTVTVNGSPTTQPIATIPTSTGDVVEGADVAPTTSSPGLVPFTGQLLVTVTPARGGNGQIFAVSPSGVVTKVTNASSPESVAFIPNSKCTLGLSSATYFTAVFGGNTIDQLPLTVPNTTTFVFAGLGGNALVTSEDGEHGVGITLLTSVNGKIATSTFEPFFAQHQGSAFVDCTTPLLLTIRRTSGPVSIGPGANGVITVDIFQTANFNPLTLCLGATTAGGQTCPSPLNVPPTFGVTGTEQSFAGCQPNLVKTAQGPALACKFFKSLVTSVPMPNFDGQLVLKGKYLGTAGDGDCEGGG